MKYVPRHVASWIFWGGGVRENLGETNCFLVYSGDCIVYKNDNFCFLIVVLKKTATQSSVLTRHINVAIVIDAFF